jgi:hypothetical protein
MSTPFMLFKGSVEKFLDYMRYRVAAANLPQSIVSEKLFVTYREVRSLES